MKIVALLLLVSAVGLTSGCASVRASGRTAWGEPTVYAGTRLNTAALDEDDAQLSIYRQYGVEAPANPRIDAPLSFAFDTLMLPVDACYGAGSTVGLGRPGWSDLLCGELVAIADSTSRHDPGF